MQKGLFWNRQGQSFLLGSALFWNTKAGVEDFFSCFFGVQGLRKSATLWLSKNHYKRLRRQETDFRQRAEILKATVFPLECNMF